MGNPAPTIKDVAARAGVSIATASNVVNGNRPVGDKSRRAVETAIAELGYRVNRAASSLRGQPSRLIGMIVPEIENVYFAGLVHRAEKEAERDGYDLLIASSSEDPAIERRRVEALVGRKVDGLLIAPYHDSPVGPFTDRALRNSLPPTVLIDRGGGVEGLDTVGAANEIGAYEATRYLIELGHRDIAVLTYNRGLANFSLRIAGYRRALAQAGFAQRERIVASPAGIENLRAAIELELHRADRASAIFALTNHSALAAIKATRGLGLDIPNDVSIVGFDDFDWMFVLRPYLTTVAQPMEEMVATSWRLLMKRIAGDRSDVQNIELPCVLRVRESTGFARRSESAIQMRSR